MFDAVETLAVETLAVETLDSISPSPRRISRAEYDRMVERGELVDQRVELLRGRIVEMSPQGAPHSWVISRLTMLLASRLNGHAVVRVQCPLAVSDDSEPEPDLAVLEPGDHRREHPTTALLVIEVADSSLRKDRRDKVPLYAETGIPACWVVDCTERRVEVYRRPEGGAYQSVETFSGDEVLRPGCLPADAPVVEFAADELF